MQQSAQLKEVTRFIADYASMLLGSGVHCSRVIRNTRRIAASFGLNVKMSVFAASIILTLTDKEQDDMHTEVVKIPEVPVSFQLNSELSALSWKAYDSPMSVAELRAEYEKIISMPRLNSWLVTLVVSLANACFCYLLGGNFLSMPIVFGATFIGYRALRFIKKRGLDHFIAVVMVSFIASALASLAVFVPGATAEVAVATSVLFMIPGVPMITGVIDLIEGHTLIGFARLMRALLIVICLAVGLSVSMVIFQNGLLFGGGAVAVPDNLLKETVIRGLFAAIAAGGFGAVSRPSPKAFFPIAVLAATGYAARYVLMQAAGFDIATSTLLAGLWIGFLSLLLGSWVKCPMTTLYIPALLPFVPGMYAYRAVFNIILFMQNVSVPNQAIPHLNDFFFNTIITATVIIAMTVGASMPMFIFSRKAKSLTRHSDLHSGAHLDPLDAIRDIHLDVTRLWHRKK